MTSKRLFVDLCSENRKRRLWPIALTIAGNFFAQIVFAMLICSSYESRLALQRTTIADVIDAFYKNAASGAGITVLLIVIGLSFINAIQGMSYLFDSRSTDLYGSLPVKREKLFDVASLNGIIIFVIPYVICHFFVIMLGVTKGFVPVSTIPAILLSGISTLICYCMCYFTCTLAAVLTGHVVIAALAAGTFATIGPAIYFAFHTYMEEFFFSYSSFEHDIGVDGYLSPILIIVRVVNAMNELRFSGFEIMQLVPVLVALVLTVVLYFATRFLIKKRPSEAAGKAISFRKTKPFIKCIISVVISLYSGLMFWELSNKFVGFIFGLVCGLIITHAVIETIFEFDFKACLSNIDTLLISTGIVAIIVSIFIFDPFKYDSWLPRTDRVASVGVSSTYGVGHLWVTDKEQTTFDVYPTQVFADSYQFKNMKMTDMAKVEPITIDGAKWAKENRLKSILRDKDYYELIDDEAEEEQNRYTFEVRWDLKSGKSIYRRFFMNVADEEIAADYDAIYNSEEFKYGTYGLLNASANDFTSVKCTDLDGEHTYQLSEEQRKEFLEAYKKDILAQTADEIRGQMPTMELFLHDDINNKRGEDFANLFVYPSYKNLNQFLETNGVSSVWSNGGDTIDTLEVWFYGEEDFSWETADKEEIKTVLENSEPSNLYNTFYLNKKDSYGGYFYAHGPGKNGYDPIYINVSDVEELPQSLRDVMHEAYKESIENEAFYEVNPEAGWVSLVSNK